MTPFAAAGQVFETPGSSVPPLRGVPPVSAGRRIAAFASGFTPADVTPRQAQMCGRSSADSYSEAGERLLRRCVGLASGSVRDLVASLD